MKRNFGLSLILGGTLSLAPLVSNATLIYDTWTSNNATGGGNYKITVEKDVINNQFDINFTIDPWNAEGLGLFIDLGDFNVPGAVGLTNIAWDPNVAGGGVSLFATDTSSNDCGNGCNLNGLNPTIPTPDGQWELVFRLASQGYQGIQSFSFSINDFGLEEKDWGVIGVRAQQLCTGDDVLPDCNCSGSDKSFGNGRPDDPRPPEDVPAPATLLLLGVGLLGLGWSRRNRITT